LRRREDEMGGEAREAKGLREDVWEVRVYFGLFYVAWPDIWNEWDLVFS